MWCDTRLGQIGLREPGNDRNPSGIGTGLRMAVVALMSARTGWGSRGVIALRYRRALIRTAVRAAAAGLPVVPGAWWDAQAGRFRCDQAGCPRTGPHPASGPDPRNPSPAAALDRRSLMAQAVRSPEAVLRCWHHAPYSVLVATGQDCDVIDVPARLGPSLALRLDARSALGPVIEAGARWFFLTQSGGRLPAPGGEVLVHGRGSWVMLPPSQGPGGEPATWVARPSRSGRWPLPAPDEVMRCLDIRVQPRRLQPAI